MENMTNNAQIKKDIAKYLKELIVDYKLDRTVSIREPNNDVFKGAYNATEVAIYEFPASLLNLIKDDEPKLYQAIADVEVELLSMEDLA